ncbi:hypothetical protein LCGC14_2907010, partial [marine sediment metagenome]
MYVLMKPKLGCPCKFCVTRTKAQH